MSTASMLARLHGRYQRETARRAFRRPMAIRTTVPLISFTFDDFPRSALLTGGSILLSHGARGTYYTSFGLMGTTAPTGPIFLPEDVAPLLEQGHELGCHTFEHRDAWSTPPTSFEQAILRNRLELQRIAPTATFDSFSYPISPPRASAKRITASHFRCCRGGGQTLNSGTADLGYLAAYFMGTEPRRSCGDEIHHRFEQRCPRMADLCDS
jgi:Polysaccharide deacetylase